MKHQKYVVFNNYNMMKSAQARHPKVTLRASQDQQAQVISLQSIKTIMRSYLSGLGLRDFNLQVISNLQTLKGLVDGFAEKVVEAKVFSASQGTLYSQIAFYKQRQGVHDQKRKQINDQLFKNLKLLSVREQEIAQREAEIFRLKLRVEQKQKTILQLMMKVNRTGKDQFLKNMEGNKNQKSEIKIVVNEPRKMAEVRERERKEESSVINVEVKRREEAAWREERKGLLKAIRQKDLKIYQLIQEINVLQKNV